MKNRPPVIAARLAEINTERQQTEQETFAEAAAPWTPIRPAWGIVCWWWPGRIGTPGSIGIVAARLMERYHRPAIVISLHEGEGRGSGRAPDRFDLHGALEGCAGYLIRFGGHAAAGRSGN